MIVWNTMHLVTCTSRSFLICTISPCRSLSTAWTFCMFPHGSGSRSEYCSMGALALLQSNALNALARVAPTASSTVITNIFFRKPGSWPEEPRMRHSPCPARLVRLGTSSALSALPCFSSAGAALVALPISIHAGLSTDCIILPGHPPLVVQPQQ